MAARTARSWFAALPSGETRSSALAITDAPFLKLFLSLAERSDAAPPSMEEITAMYLQFANETPVVHTNGKRSKNKSTPTQPSHPQIDITMPPKPKTETTPILSEETPHEVLTSPASSEEKLTKLLNMLISHVCAIFPSVFSGDLNEVERLRVGDTTSSFGRGKGKRGRKQAFNNGDTVAALTLDPSILGSPGGSSLFYNLADKIVDLMWKEMGVEGESMGFLMQGDASWPTWMILGKDENEEQSKQMLGIFLLAGFQMSIENSYQRWLAKHMESTVSTVKVGDILFHIGGEPALRTFWQFSPPNATATATSAEADADAKMGEEIERIFRIKKSYAEDDNSGEKMLALLSREEVAQLEANFQLQESFKPENLLVTPLPWILSSSSVTQVCQNWNRLMVGVWSKMARSLSSGGGGGGGKKNQKQEGNLLALEDVESLGELPMSPNKKKKKKNKKKHKKKTNGHDGSNQAKPEQAQPGQSNASAKAVDPVPSIDQSSAIMKETEPIPSTAVAGDTQENSTESAVDGATAVTVIEPPKITREINETPSTDIQPNADESTEAEASKPPAEDKAENASAEATSATKDQEGSKGNDDADDVWETVAAKPRKPKAKPSNDQSNNNNNTSITNKSNSQNNRSQSGRNNGSAVSGEGGGSNDRRKNKKRRDRDRNRGKRDQTRVVKDVLTQILDAVDNEVNRRAKQGTKSVSSEDKRRSATDKRSIQSSNRNTGNDQRRKAASAPSTANNAKDPRSLRDVVAGVSAAPPKNNVKAKPAAEPSRGAKIKPGLSYKSVIEPTPQQPAVVSPSTTNQSKAHAAKLNDSKVPDVKSSSVVENETAKPKSKSGGETEAKHDQPTTPSKKESATPVVETDTKEMSAKEDSCETPASTSEDDRNTPPLSTLLGPGTSCSASSSVASSLEAPHSSRFRHQSISTTEDVGVHLLNVCKQMSEEIDTFMSRRSLALDVRRKERSAVLGALQDTLVKLWPGSCHVEMYGSCATQLDLPSSDLDLVVCGLDEMMMSHIPIEHAASSIMQSPTGSVHNLHQSPSGSAQNLNQSFENSTHSLPPQSPGQLAPEPQIPNHQDFEALQVEPDPVSDQLTDFVPEGEPGMIYDASDEDVTMGMEGYNSNPDYHPTQQDYYYVPYNYIPPMSLNAQRVLRLASELEMQPWAVQVKAIPTAAVPVVKMLADPSRLPGAVGSGSNWIMQQHIAAQAGSPGTPPMPPDQIPATQNQFIQKNQSSSSHFFSQPSMPSWRGADIMNGLQPVDITFEGPEHGGIGSTTYSACVVQDACNETGLPPESTPIVQVAMVLKELLAQRRLNEPFSGGLSSYALLLLLLAVLKDRRVIQEEMEHVEKQRREVERLDANDTKVSQKQNNPAPRLSAAQVVAGKSTTSKPSKGGKVENASSAVDSSKKVEVAAEKKAEGPNPLSKKISTSSWASIAKKSNGSTALTDSISTVTSSMPTKRNVSDKSRPVQSSGTDQAKNVASKNATAPTLVQSSSTMNSAETESEPVPSKITSALPQSKLTLEGQVTPSTAEESKLRAPLIPQCSNDILEVLCSGELTAGKLLMHFLLFYGQQFDAQTTLIDINGTHHPEFGRMDREKLSPFVPRPPGGTIDPVTGMYSVDPIVVYDPLEGAMDHNVSKRCYCWNNVRWVFAQCYMTVSSVVETSGTSTKNATKARHRGDKRAEDSAKAAISSDHTSQEPSGTNSDITTPILELLLSF